MNDGSVNVKSSDSDVGGEEGEEAAARFYPEADKGKAKARPSAGQESQETTGSKKYKTLG